MLNEAVTYLARVTPKPIKTIFVKMGFDRLVNLLLDDKYRCELDFQKEWAVLFKENKNKVLEYWQNYRYLDEINHFCNITNETRVLDVGCGISSVLHFVKGNRYGIDPLMDEYTKLYKYPPELNVKKSRGETIPFPDEFFDVVFDSNSLDHVTSPQKVVNEIFRVLKNNGKFVLTVELFENNLKRNPAHPHSFTREYVDRLLAERFKEIFRQKSPWIGLQRYVHGHRNSDTEELVLILTKK